MKYAVCNELFGDLELRKAAATLKAAGFGGIEFAPYTVFGDFSPAMIRNGLARIAEALAGEGLEFVGFHWLMVGPEPLHLTTTDESLRQRSLGHLRRLLDAAGELGGGALILGSPKQRSSVAGSDRATAVRKLSEGLAGLGDHAISCGSRILLEALDSGQTDVVNTLAEAHDLVEAIGSPGIGEMFDFHNVGDETEPWDTLIRAQGERIAHIHINEMDGRAPGTGTSDYGPAFEALRDIGYKGWISMEIFEKPADPGAVVERALRFLARHDRAIVLQEDGFKE
ncbi:MAG TPA: sugar phosphate isomerase/epimerase family protein [Rectinemataceae bacterium]|nr:sugar phosphate isomerase/epimerase family protein [Rectinemataceae bacterium]